jgi:hypothetical protein
MENTFKSFQPDKHLKKSGRSVFIVWHGSSLQYVWVRFKKLTDTTRGKAESMGVLPFFCSGKFSLELDESNE